GLLQPKIVPADCASQCIFEPVAGAMLTTAKLIRLPTSQPIISAYEERSAALARRLHAEQARPSTAPKNAVVACSAVAARKSSGATPPIKKQAAVIGVETSSSNPMSESAETSLPNTIFNGESGESCTASSIPASR